MLPAARGRVLTLVNAGAALDLTRRKILWHPQRYHEQYWLLIEERAGETS
jgi:hypothetical protein